MELVKIKETNTTTIKQAVFTAMVLTGFKPQNIDVDSLNVIISSIQRGFPTLTMDEFKTAFEMGVDGKLGIDLTTYQNFNSLYISNVLQAFNRYKIKNNLIIKLDKPMETKQLDKPKISKEENAANWYDFVKKEVAKSGKVPFMADWVACYWYMEQNNFINLTKEEKQMFADNVRVEMELDVKKRKVEGKDFQTEMKILEDKKSFANECRKQYVIKYFEK